LDPRKLVDIDKRRVWHPYTPMQEYIEQGEPIVVARAAGARFYDAAGKSYIDANSSWWTAALGHAHPRLTAVVERQSRTLGHVPLAGIVHEPAALLAEELVAVAPAGLERVFFSDNGSTSVEVAMKLALQYWFQNGRPSRRRFVALDGAFHGETLGATALGGVEVFRRPFASVLVDCVRVPHAPDGHGVAFAALERLVREHADEIAAVVLEPMVQGAAGMRIYDAALLERARAVTREVDTFLVLDEVFSGYGRTGPMWAGFHAGVEPDMMCVAKAFSGGLLPMSATLVSERVFEGFLGDATRAFFYGHTFAGNPLGAALAREVLAVYRDEEILRHAEPKSRRIAAAFERFGQLDGARGARSIGMIGAVDLEEGSGYLARAGWRVFDEARSRGVYLRPLGNVVYVAPPLNIPDADLDELLEVVGASLAAVLEPKGH